MIGWGILGNATVARLAVGPAIARSRNGFVAAVGSRDLERAHSLCRTVGGTPLQGYEAVLAHPAVNAVYIPLPNHLHKPWTLKALAAGKHVLVEKPFAMNAAEAREMATAAVNAGCQLLEAFMWRFHPRAQRIRQLVRSGELGRIRAIRAAFTFVARPESSNQRLFDKAMGGGALWDVGAYGVSLARWLLNEEPESASAQALWHENGVDIGFAGTLRFPSGILATIEAGLSAALQQTFSILGDQGAIEIPWHDGFIPGRRAASFVRRAADAPTGSTFTLPGADQYQLMVEHFAAVIMGESKLAFSPDDSVRQMTSLEALMQAAKSEMTVRF